MTVSGQGTTYNLPNYIGPLFNISPTETPTLTMIGGVNAARGIRATEFGFQTESLPAASQPENLEGQDAPTASEEARTAVTNVTQIFHETVNISYTKQGATEQVTATFLGTQPVQNEFDHQVNLKLRKVARDLNYTVINGAYQKPANNASARKTRGILAAITTNAVAAGSAALSKALINNLLRTMYGNGAPFVMPIIKCGAFQKQALSALYGYAPTDRNVGGINIKQIETDFGVLGVMIDRDMPAGTLAVVEYSVLQLVATITKDVDGNDRPPLFYEPLAKTGAAEKGQIYGELGLDHGPETFHGKITGLATS